jgi:predicted regulator of Ras-like GTPase activity (Roadblock/LC7/MglB family)
MFKESLQKVVDTVEGGIASLVMGFDGIAVDAYTKPPGESAGLDMNTVGMEFSFILTQVRKAAEILEVGALTELTLKSEKLIMIMKVLSNEYFLALAMGPEGNFGKGRYLLRLIAPKLQAEL